MRKLLPLLLLTLSSCADCKEAARDFGTWTSIPIKQATMGDILLLILLGSMIFWALSSTLSIRVKKP